MVTILISAAFRGAALIREEALVRGRCLFQCRHPKERRLLEDGAYSLLLLLLLLLLVRYLMLTFPNFTSQLMSTIQ